MAIHKIDGVDGDNSSPKKVVTLHCTGAITKGDWVVIDLADATNGRGQSVKKSCTAIDATAFGVALETLTAAGPLQVQTAGLNTNVLLDASIAVGKPLICDATAGAGSLFADGDLVPPVGIYIGDDGSTNSVAAATNLVMIIDQGYF